MYLISVIIPCYNVAQYIEQCILSLLEDINFDKFEFILVNDGSTDNTLSAIGSLEQKYPNIHCINQKNSGQSAARNVGIKSASGLFLGFIDGDDWVSPNYFSNMLSCAQKDNADVVIANLCSVYEDGTIDIMNTRLYKIDDFSKFNVVTCEERLNVCSLYLKDRLSVSPCNKLYKKTFYKENNLHFPVGLYNEDMEFTFDTLTKATLISKIESSIYYYRQNATSTTKIATLRVLDMLTIVDNILKKVKEMFGDELRQQSITFFLNNSVYVTVMRLRLADIVIREEVINIISREIKRFSFTDICVAQDISIKRKGVFLLIKYYPNSFLKIINRKWKLVS